MELGSGAWEEDSHKTAAVIGCMALSSQPSLSSRGKLRQVSMKRKQMKRQRIWGSAVQPKDNFGNYHNRDLLPSLSKLKLSGFLRNPLNRMMTQLYKRVDMCEEPLWVANDFAMWSIAEQESWYSSGFENTVSAHLRKAACAWGPGLELEILVNPGFHHVSSWFYEHSLTILNFRFLLPRVKIASLELVV